MATYNEIKINYDNSKKKATKIEELAEQLRAIAKNDLDETLNMLSNEWKGESSTAFLHKGEALKDELLKTANLMDRNARSIRATAKKIYDTERAAIDLIESHKKMNGGGGASW